MTTKRQQLPTWTQPGGWEVRWSKYAPKYNLIEDKIFAAHVKRADVDPVDTLERGGQTHSADTPDTLTSRHWGLPNSSIFARSGRPSNNEKGKYGGFNLTRDDCRAVATGEPLHGLYGDQFGEGSHWLWLTSPQTRWYYERIRERMKEMNRPDVKIFGTYGALEFYIIRNWDGLPTDSKYRQYYASQAAARQSCGYFKANLQEVMGGNVSWYPYAFDYAQDYYMRAHSMEIMRLGMGKDGMDAFCPLFLWGQIEANGLDFIHNGHHWERDLPNGLGRIRTARHPNADYDAVLAQAFANGFVRGSGVISWDEGTRFGSDPNTATNFWSEWQGRNGARLPFRNPHFPDSPASWHDACCVASLWYQSCERTAGKKWNYLRYRVNNGPWIEPARDGATILEHATANHYYEDGGRLQLMGRGDTMGRFNGNAYDWFYYNPGIGKHQSETVTVELNGKRFTQEVQGKTLCVCNETA